MITENDIRKRSSLMTDQELINDILNIKTEDNFTEFVDKLEALELPNDTEYEYYNAAYWFLHGTESSAYVTE